MSNNAHDSFAAPVSAPRALPPLRESNADIDAELVDKIAQKTEEGKVSWSRTPKGHSGRSIDGSLHIELLDWMNPVFGKTWQTFTVTQGGRQVLSLTNEVNGLMALAGIAPSAAHRRVSALRNSLETVRVGQVRSALETLENL